MEENIDLSPVSVAAVLQHEAHVVIQIPAQPCYSRATGADPIVTPRYACEMLVTEGKIEKLETSFPFETDEWELSYRNGSRACFLPFDFETEGPIRLVFYNDTFPTIVITGSHFSLKILDEVGSVEERIDQAAAKTRISRP